MSLPTRRRRVTMAGQRYPNIAASFSGLGAQYATIVDNASLSGGAFDYSIVYWLNVPNAAVDQTTVSKFNTTGNQREFRLRLQSANSRILTEFSSDGATVTSVSHTTFGALSANTWYMHAARLDNTNNLIRTSINAGPVDTVAFATDVFDGTADFRVGALGDATALLAGRVDCLGFWKTAVGGGGHLSDAQLVTLYKGGVGMAYRDLPADLKTGLVSFWNFDGNLRDSHGTNHLTNNNGVSFVGGKR